MKKSLEEITLSGEFYRVNPENDYAINCARLTYQKNIRKSKIVPLGIIFFAVLGAASTCHEIEKNYQSQHSYGKVYGFSE